MKTTILFDLDGTLTDPGLGITNSVMYALEKLGYEVPAREKLYKYIGPPLSPLIKFLISFICYKLTLTMTTCKCIFSIIYFAWFNYFHILSLGFLF